VQNGDEPLFLRFRGAGRLQRRNLAALEGLLQYRRELAVKKDRPLFKVFSNTSLLKIASDMLDNPKAMEMARCLSTKQIRIYGNPLSSIVKKARDMADDTLPVYPRKRRPSVPPKVPERTKAIKAWRDDLAQRLEIDPALLFNKALITAIAVKKPLDIDALRHIDGIRNWQVGDFGETLIKLLATHP
jgi:ribonuclease D